MPSTLGIVASHKRNVAAPTLPMTGLTGWWDADDASTFSYTSGVSVSQWRDKSGNACHLNGGGVLTRNGTQNGRTCVTAPGGGAVGSSAPATTATDNFAMFVACKCTGGSSAFENGQTSNSGYAIAQRAQGPYAGFLRGGVAWHSSTTPDTGAPTVQTLTRTAGAWGHWVDGAATSVSGSSGAPNTPALRTAIPSVDQGYTGLVFEALIYNRVLSTVERQQVESYLKTKWGTP